jgi:type I restriction enzyme M protein
MNLAVHGLEGDIKKAITYYADPHELVGKADFVMANPPFNVDEIDADKIKSDPRLPFGLPSVNDKGKVSNGNYVWISYFYSYLNDHGRAGFVMAAGAESAGRGDALVRRKLIETGAVDVMVSIRSNFFYTRTVPCVLWFLNRAKRTDEQKDRVLMIDARNVYRKVTRKINDFSPEQEQNLLAIVWLYRGETERYKQLLADYRKNGETEAAAWLEERFPDARYRNVEGLVKVVTREEIAANDWSLTPGRYVGVAETDSGDEDFAEKFAALHEELRQLNAEAAKLAEKIDANFKELMG